MSVSISLGKTKKASTHPESGVVFAFICANIGRKRHHCKGIVNACSDTTRAGARGRRTRRLVEKFSEQVASVYHHLVEKKRSLRSSLLPPQHPRNFVELLIPAPFLFLPGVKEVRGISEPIINFLFQLGHNSLLRLWRVDCPEIKSGNGEPKYLGKSAWKS